MTDDIVRWLADSPHYSLADMIDENKPLSSSERPSSFLNAPDYVAPLKPVQEEQEPSTTESTVQTDRQDIDFILDMARDVSLIIQTYDNEGEKMRHFQSALPQKLTRFACDSTNPHTTCIRTHKTQFQMLFLAAELTIVSNRTGKLRQ